jgi:hypothetical protein
MLSPLLRLELPYPQVPICFDWMVSAGQFLPLEIYLQDYRKPRQVTICGFVPLRIKHMRGHRAKVALGIGKLLGTMDV